MLKEWVDLFFQSWSSAIDLVKKPLGILVFIGLLLIGSFALTFWQRNVGYEQAKKEDSIVISDKDKRIATIINHVHKQDDEIAALYNKMSKIDCIDQSERIFDLLQRLKEKEDNSLRNERIRTAELNRKLEKL